MPVFKEAYLEYKHVYNRRIYMYKLYYCEGAAMASIGATRYGKEGKHLILGRIAPVAPLLAAGKTWYNSPHE
jgi:hypothetical protein